jgi:uncharacterized protein YndB with AHSA1/START domain
MKTILHVVDIADRPAAAYAALTRPEGLSRWWSTKVTAQPEVGSTVDWTFVDGFNPDMEITALEPDRLVEWRCVGGHGPWQDNTFHFELTSLDDGRTRLRFRQEYARELGDDDYGTYNFNWGYYLQSLKEYIETGTGKPYEA